MELKSKLIRIIILFLFIPLSLFSFSKINISGIRFGFFIVEISDNNYLNNKDMVIFSETGSVLCRYYIVNSLKNMFLCRMDGVDSDLNENCFVKAELKKTDKKGLSKKNISYKKDVEKKFSYHGINFIEISEKIIISKEVIPILRIKDISFKSINNFILDIQSKCDKNFRAGLMSLNEIEHFFSVGKNRILLGISEGRIIMIYKEKGKIESASITESTIKKFRENIFFPLILKKM